MKCLRQFYRIFTVCFILLTLCILTVCAANGDGTGSKPLNFVSCSLNDRTDVADGAEVSVQPSFTLHFDKNVVNMLVWLNNRSCVEILTSDDKQVPADVTKIDDTVDSANKQEIFLKPQEALDPNSVYYIYVSPKLTAKNSVSLSGSTDGKGITIKFITTAETAAESGLNAPVQNRSVFSYRSPVSIVIIVFSVICILVLGIFVFKFLKKKNLPPKEKSEDDTR